MSNSQQNTFLCSAAITAVILFSCKPANTQSEVRVVGGVETSQFPAVVELGNGGTCTGSFVATNAILTAAHCAWMDISFGNALPTQNMPHPQFSQAFPGKLSASEVSRDLRLLIFNKALSEDILAISFARAQAGDTGTIVGFGCDDFAAKTGAGIKRTGQIKLSRVSDSALIAARNETSACPGDSGGPLLNADGSIIGVTSRAGPDGYSEWVNLNSLENRQFIATGLKKAEEILAGVTNENSNTTNQGVTTPTENNSTTLDCNTDYQQIRRTSGPGICKNSTSGFCYRYDRGEILYDRGYVQCPNN